MSFDEIAACLDILLKQVVPSVTDIETGFQITFLQNNPAAQTLRQLNSWFQWVKANQYSLLALLNFVPSLVNFSSTSMRAMGKLPGVEGLAEYHRQS